MSVLYPLRSNRIHGQIIAAKEKENMRQNQNIPSVGHTFRRSNIIQVVNTHFVPF